MRTYQWLAAVIVGAAFAVPSQAQSAAFSNPNTTNVLVVPPGGANLPIAQPQTQTTFGQKLVNFFSWPAQISGSPVIGTSTFPTQSQQPGTAYLQGFGYQPVGPPASSWWGWGSGSGSGKKQ